MRCGWIIIGLLAGCTTEVYSIDTVPSNERDRSGVLVEPGADPGDGNFTSGRSRGLTWAVKRVHTSEPFVLVGCKDCDPYRGDTSCNQALPVLCVAPTDATSPEETDFYKGWSGHVADLTPPIRGTDLKSLENVNQTCADHFGPEWRMAEFHHPEGGWNWWAEGDIELGARFWIWINDQNAHCWQER